MTIKPIYITVSCINKDSATKLAVRLQFRLNTEGLNNTRVHPVVCEKFDEGIKVALTKPNNIFIHITNNVEDLTRVDKNFLTFNVEVVDVENETPETLAEPWREVSGMFPRILTDTKDLLSEESIEGSINTIIAGISAYAYMD